jgi:hypothetical protein
MAWLQLKFEDKGAGLVAGAAWVVYGDTEVTPDCASFRELECRLKELQDDLEAIRNAARKEFERCQGGGKRKPTGPETRPAAPRRYIVDVCEDNDEELENSLHHMSERGWRLVSTMWLPKRMKAAEELNAQYTMVFEREDCDAPRP